MEDKKEIELTKKLHENLSSFCNEKFYIEAANLSHDEIIKKYGDKPIAIAKIPESDPVFKGIWKDAKSNLVYTGLGSFIDHWVNHHPELEPSDFMKIQDVLSNPDSRYFDKTKNAVIFDKFSDGLHDVVIMKKAADKLIYERSSYMPRKLPKRWQEIEQKNGIVKQSFVDGHPTISQSEKSEAGIVRNISTLNDTKNIAQTNEKSTQTEKNSESKLLYEKTTVNVDGLERDCEHGLLDGFKNAVKMVDRLKKENSQLKKENIELHKRLEQKSHSKNHHEKEIER